MPSVWKERGAAWARRLRGALSGLVSRGQGGWIIVAGMRKPGAMIRSAPALALLALSSGALAASDLGVLPQGRYACWTAGSASGPAEVPHSEFVVVRGSSYRNELGRGTYLLASDVLLFTRGPMKDMRFRRSKDGFWQQLSRDGEPGRLKCSRTGAAPPVSEV